MSFEVPAHVRPVREAVLDFVRRVVEPAEPALEAGGPAAAALLRELQDKAKAAGLWALGHPTGIGGGGMPFLDYVYVNEVQGRSEYGQFALGTHSLQDSLMLDRWAAEGVRERWLAAVVAAETYPSFAMTEPGRSSSDPTQLQVRAEKTADGWRVSGRKWWTTGAGRAGFTTVLCRTEDDGAPPHQRFSLLLVPTDRPGYRIVRELPALGLHHGHFEIELTDVEVPDDHLVGPRGGGFAVAQDRLGPGRIFHAMRWLGQAQRAFELLCDRLNDRSAFGEPLAAKQLMQQHVFESYAQIQACRLLTLQAAAAIDAGSQARVEIGTIKVVGARMVHDVVDRALQVHGAEGLSDDTPLSLMYRAARFARIYDGPDEVHVQSVAKGLLGRARAGRGWDFSATGGGQQTDRTASERTREP